MIDFRCNCKFQFSVPAELAGDMMQCPQCGRLVDVPVISELSSLEEDGLYKVDDTPPPPPDLQTFENIARAFSRQRHDEDGYPIDNRGVYAPEPEPLPVEPEKPATLKYDPFTGELIQELKIVEPVHEAIPVARPVTRPSRSKRKLMDEPSRFELAALPGLLLKPINLLVMVFIFLGQVLAQAMVVGFAFNPAIGFFWFLLQAAMIAHFGNVIDETGPTNRQELPVPLRSLEWGEDIFRPLFQTFLSLAICYLPGVMVLVVLRNAPPQLAIGLSLSLMLAGTLVFPAVWLTATTSGTILNLRPDRVWSVIVALGVEYVFVLLTWTAGGLGYLMGAAMVTLIGIDTMARSSPLPVSLNLPPFFTWWMGYSIMAGGVYLMHLLGWQLGTLYRKHYQRFHWMLQRFNRDEQRAAEPMGFAVKRVRQPQQAVPAQSFPSITE